VRVRAAVSEPKRSLLTMESPFPEQHSMLRFLEPPGTCTTSLWTRLFDGSYGRPFIVDSRLKRFLHFDLDAVQSAMDLRQPDRLCLAYTRKMMAFLLFNRAPRRILLLGLGGGSLAKFCYRRLPKAAFTAVEVSDDVLALREEFCLPADDDRFRVVRADGAAYVERVAACKDVILADACDHVGVAPELDALEFYRNAHRALAPGGVFVANLCGNVHARAAHLLKIRQAFGDDYLLLPVRADGNVIVFAFRDGRRPRQTLVEMTAAAGDLKRALGLDFPRYVRRIVVEQKRRGAPRELA
jgi:spermidine synthase